MFKKIRNFMHDVLVAIADLQKHIFAIRSDINLMMSITRNSKEEQVMYYHTKEYSEKEAFLNDMPSYLNKVIAIYDITTTEGAKLKNQGLCVGFGINISNISETNGIRTIVKKYIILKDSLSNSIKSVILSDNYYIKDL